MVAIELGILETPNPLPSKPTQLSIAVTALMVSSKRHSLISPVYPNLSFRSDTAVLQLAEISTICCFSRMITKQMRVAIPTAAEPANPNQPTCGEFPSVAGEVESE